MCQCIKRDVILLSNQNLYELIGLYEDKKFWVPSCSKWAFVATLWVRWLFLACLWTNLIVLSLLVKSVNNRAENQIQSVTLNAHFEYEGTQEHIFHKNWNIRERRNINKVCMSKRKHGSSYSWNFKEDLVHFFRDWKLMYLKRFWTGIVLGIVIVLTFASIFIA